MIEIEGERKKEGGKLEKQERGGEWGKKIE